MDCVKFIGFQSPRSISERKKFKRFVSFRIQIFTYILFLIDHVIKCMNKKYMYMYFFLYYIIVHYKKSFISEQHYFHI